MFYRDVFEKIVVCFFKEDYLKLITKQLYHNMCSLFLSVEEFVCLGHLHDTNFTSHLHGTSSLISECVCVCANSRCIEAYHRVID